MLTEFQKKLTSVAGYKDSRQKYADEVLDNPELLAELIPLCFETSDKCHPKACWVFELICIEKIDSIKEFLDFFCSNIEKLTNESAIRSISKVCFLLTVSHFKKKEIQLTENHLEQIAETCFDWLIKDTKVASKAHVMRTLYLLGHHFDWIHPELKTIITKDFPNHTPAYKAVAKEVLKKIK